MRLLDVIATFLLTTAFAGVPSALAEDRDASKILADAFQTRYGADMTSEIELTMRDHAGREHRRLFDAASKVIDGKLHSVGKLNWPDYLRDMTILTIEAGGRDHDAFVYLPSLDRIRRISSAQRGDSFFGTDITYEDLERRYADEFEIVSIEPATTGGEASHRIRATPLERMTFNRVDYFVAQSDGALLEVRFFREGSDSPHRIVYTERSKLIESESFIVPTVIVVENTERRTVTTAVFRNLRINPAIDPQLFSTTVLQRNPSLRAHADETKPAFNAPEEPERDAR